MTALPGPWADHALCKGRTSDWVQHTTYSRTTPALRPHDARAVTACHQCPVLEPCRAWALTTPDPAEGMIAGGLTLEQRRQARRETAA